MKKLQSFFPEKESNGTVLCFSDKNPTGTFESFITCEAAVVFLFSHPHMNVVLSVSEGLTDVAGIL